MKHVSDVEAIIKTIDKRFGHKLREHSGLIQTRGSYAAFWTKTNQHLMEKGRPRFFEDKNRGNAKRSQNLSQVNERKTGVLGGGLTFQEGGRRGQLLGSGWRH